MSLAIRANFPGPLGLPGLNLGINLGQMGNQGATNININLPGAHRPGRNQPCKAEKGKAKSKGKAKGKGKGKAKKGGRGCGARGPKSPQRMMMKLMSMMMSLMSSMQGGGGCCGGGFAGSGGGSGLNVNINQFRNPGFLA